MRYFIKNSRIKHVFIILILLFFFIFISAISYVNAVSTNIANSVFRLHVIANSDSVEDQNLKYKVRDEILKYMNIISKDCNSKEEIIDIVCKNKDKFLSIAQEVIRKNGYSYDVNIEIGKSSFPTKHYGDITLPAGNYDSLKIEIGKSQGQNWWCVMFPPLCFIDVSSGIVPEESKSIIQNNLNEEEYNIISNKTSLDIQVKFSLIEMFQNFKVANK